MDPLKTCSKELLVATWDVAELQILGRGVSFPPGVGVLFILPAHPGSVSPRTEQRAGVCSHQRPSELIRFKWLR